MNDDVVNVIIDQTQGLDWADVKAGTTDTGDPNSLASELLDVLDGKTITAIDPATGNPIQIEITDIPGFSITGGTDDLVYYDPGLAPAYIDNDPNDTFDTKGP